MVGSVAVNRARPPRDLSGQGAIGGCVDQLDQGIEVVLPTQLPNLHGQPPQWKPEVPDRAKAGNRDFGEGHEANSRAALGAGGHNPPAAQPEENAYGQRTSGGIEERMELTLPPVLSPNVVPRS